MMEKSLKVSIIRPGKAPLTAQAASVTIPAWNGQLGIFYNRQPLMSVLEPGLIALTNDNGIKTYFATTGGFAEVKDNVVTLLCDSLITEDSTPTDSQSKKLLEQIQKRMAQ